MNRNIVVLLIALFACLPTSPAPAGDREGNGGDQYKLMIQSYASRVAKLLRTETTGKLAKVDVDALIAMADAVTIIPKPYVEIAGTEVDAKNYTPPPTIELNTGRWDRADEDTRMSIVFHELGNLIGIDFVNYPYSRELMILLKEHRTRAVNYRVKELALGWNHSCALLEDGEVQCWGNGGHGILGSGEDREAATSVVLEDEHGNPKLDKDGHVMTERHLAIRPPMHVVGLREPVKSISAGLHHTCALLESGKLSCWGEIDDELWTPLEDVAMLSRRFEEFYTTSPRYVYGMSAGRKTGEIDTLRSERGYEIYSFVYDTPNANDVFDMATLARSSQERSFVRTRSGKLYSLQMRGYGVERRDIDQVKGAGVEVSTRFIPDRVTDIAYSSNHTCFLTERSEVWCVGSIPGTEGTASAGQRGLNGKHARKQTIENLIRGGVKPEYAEYHNLDAVPTKVPGISNAVSIANTWQATCALLASGEVKCWGHNNEGERGSGKRNYKIEDFEPNFVLTKKSLFSSRRLENVKKLSGSGNHFCAVTANGKVYCWGANSHLECGVPAERSELMYKTTDKPTPYAVTSATEVLGLRGKAIGVATGAYHSCAILENGRVQCWGDNTFGQLGDSSMTEPSATPLAVQGLAW